MNISSRLVNIARQYPDMLAVVEPNGRSMTFAELNGDSDRIAAALIQSGVKPGERLALFVRYGIDFISLVFALCKAHATLVLIDPGMGIRRMLHCLAEVEPDGFVAVPAVHAVRFWFRSRFPKAKHHLTVGRRWFWGGLSLNEIRKTTSSKETAALLLSSPATNDNELAAIIFTSGSTGAAKGVAFTHQIFDTQVSEIAERYHIQPGEVDLACFPFFGLFDAAMGVTAVIPDINPTLPAKAEPAKIVAAANQWKITQSFASPALWNRVADYCTKTGKRLETLRRAVSAGAPVSAATLAKLKPCIHPDGDIFTPYGATEALPVASISASEVLGETVNLTRLGNGVCVGKRFNTITWKVIEISDGSFIRIEDAKEVEQGQIGELAVKGPQVTTMYVNRPEANKAAKMYDAEGDIWHRMGDVGYLDAQDRFWFCGRKAHRIETPERTYFTVTCEAIFNVHPRVYRSALASSPSKREPRMFIEPLPEHYPKTKKEKEQLIAELLELGSRNPLTESIKIIKIMKNFPVDVRHNIKINRELLSEKK
jgi:acyl-CoA synthetase (AMP-forming)/AMP-acid ligase II